MQLKFFQKPFVAGVALLILLVFTFFASTGTSWAASASTSVKSPSSSIRTSNSPNEVDIYCLGVSMSMTNPQLDVIYVYTSLKNNCSVTVTSVELSWDTDVVCNGGSTNGPHDVYHGTSLAPGQSDRWSQGYSAICYSNQPPYFPTSYKIQGYAEGFAIYSSNADALGDTTTIWYTFI